jgi:hypothetical protein
MAPHDLQRKDWTEPETKIEEVNNPKNIAEQLFSVDHIDVKSELTHNEIANAVRFEIVGEYLEVPVFSQAIEFMLRAKVSKDRKGRVEVKEVMAAGQKKKDAKGFLSSLFGKKEPNDPKEE